MAAPLAGIRVVEVANWLAAPSAAAMMRDLGADVIKVEPPDGDAYRGVLQGLELDHNYPFELDNRGKRSIALALDKPGASELVRRLAGTADIFITNLVQPRRQRFGLTDADLRAAFPGLIYVSFSGYGSEGPDAARAGFDYTAFWARSGIWALMGDASGPPALSRSGQGDHTTAMNLLAATLVALRLKEQTGEGQTVEVTLQRTGLWTIGADVSQALVTKQQLDRFDRREMRNPLAGSYETRDGRWLLLMMPASDNYWAPFCRMVGREEWIEDPQYADVLARRDHGVELSPLVQEIFLTDDLAGWRERLDTAGLIWGPGAELPEVVEDPQLRVMGAFETIEHPDPAVGSFETLATPFRITDADIAVRGPAPEIGQHTYEVLEELGVTTDEVAELALAGVLG
ncbi:MAG: Crotonobetainyl-CoA:carnitine CoA-transferase CaiB [Chloroflexi bacterium]|nr:MAG: Crotonobetainyl-CoA:carnitine CoA-transferase CaiB [Chloroflexota bacterium]